MADHALLAHLAEARPKALAALTRYFRDLDLAEDAFQEAAARALVAWRAAGLPRDPTAWLVFAGRNAALDQVRKTKRHRDYLAGMAPIVPEDEEARRAAEIDMNELRDDVLRLLFMCCQPGLQATDQLALELKVVGGFGTSQVARALLVKPKTMEQRLTRAKRRAARIAADLEPPTLAERAKRLDAVALMVYLMFNEGYAAGGGPVHIRAELCDEAIRLARLLLSLFPAQTEIMGLLALFLFQNSRRRARLAPDGGLVRLEDQDRGLWDRAQIEEGRVLVQKALRRGRPGPYQIQAAIAAVHATAGSADETDWAEIERLYRALELVQPSPVVSLNRAVALAKTEGPEAALALLGGLEGELAGYLYFHTTRAALLAEAGQDGLELEPTRAEAAHIARTVADLAGS
jgi:RNA polymerase sigma-70 factor (ECF subfamily)